MRWSSLCVVLLGVVALLAVHASAECPPGVELQNCLVNPCDAQPCAGASRCEADYCGGCNYNCICSADEDCASGKEFCRPSSFENDAPSFCTAYATVGESCGGFIPPPFSKQCSPDLTCVYQRFIPDAPGTCYASCSDDSDCGEDFFCSINGYCVEDGGCGETKDCSDPNNSFIVPACVGYASCEQGSCSWTCGDLPACQQDFDCPRDYICDQNTNTCALSDDEPVHSGSCADGSDPLSCLVAPCDVENPCSVAEACVNDYCGGCNARCVCTSDSDCVEGKEWCRTSGVPVPGELGKRVLSYCTSFAGLGESCGGEVLPAFQEICAEGLECAYLNPLIADIPGQCLPTCAQDSDCADEFFCSESGFCVEDGQCAVLNDCSNPNNNFISVDCVGYTTCDFGTCGVTCGELPACEEDFDCSFGYFCDKNTNTCAVGEPVPSGSCPDGSDLFSCFVAPCDVENPCAKTEACVNDYCGGCNARCTCESDKDCASGKEWCRPSKANDGTSVCTPYAGLGESCGGFVLPAYREICAEGLECVNLNPFIADIPGQCLPTCSLDSDCADEFFCSENGFCVEDGQCAVLNDCSNPNNNYASVKCIGYTTCDFGTCGITCGELPACEEDFECSFGYFCDKNTNTCAVGDGNENPVGECPNGLDLVQCFAEPCSVGSSCKNPKNCYSDYCGGCNTHCTCKSDNDCHSGKEWCRVADRFYQNEESGEILSFCTPFAGLGESCGGFVVPSSLRLCADGLECVNLNPFIADAPGTCMKVCSEDRDCRKDSFCSTRGVCVKDGQCGSLSDCFDDNNNYPVIECVGYTTCEESSCGVTCGQTPACEEDFECPFGYACDKASASCVRSTENTCSCGAVDPSGFEICADGSLSGPVCTETSDGDCSFVYRACPEETECNGRGQCKHAIGGKCLGSCINKQCSLSNFDRCYNLEAQIVLLYERIIGLRSIASPSKIADDIAKIISFPRASIVLLEGANGYVVIEFLQNKKHDAFEAARTLRKLIANNDASVRDSALANLDILVLNPEAEGDSSVDSSESTQKTDSGRSNSDATSNTFSDNGNSKSAAAQLVFSVFSLLVAFLLF